MKRCRLCQSEKPLHEFGRLSRSSDGLQSLCRDCNKARSKAYYRRNTAHHRQIIKANNARYQELVHRNLVAYLVTHPCVDCGETDIRVLEFDHRPEFEKSRDVSYLIRGGTSWRRVSEEIAKCDVRCRNCHAIITFARSPGNWRTAAHRSIQRNIQRFLDECESAWSADSRSSSL